MLGENIVLTMQANIQRYGNAGYLDEKVNCSVSHTCCVLEFLVDMVQTHTTVKI